MTSTVIESFRNQGILSINIQKYGRLEITTRGQSFLRDYSTFYFKDINGIKLSSKQITASRREKVTILSDTDETTLTQLKNLRLELARERSVPAYVIFSDATLLDMIAKRPTCREEMLEVSGVGQVKLEKYGDVFLEVLA